MQPAYVATDGSDCNLRSKDSSYASQAWEIHRANVSTTNCSNVNLGFTKINHHEPKRPFQHYLSATGLSTLCPVSLRLSLGLVNTSPEQLQYQRASRRSKLFPANWRTNFTYSCIQTDLNGVNYLRHVHSARLSSGHKYRYVNYRPCNSSKPTILFLHGFPSSSYDWRRQYDYFASRGYGILASDLLGYGGSDKPSNVEAYTLKNQANDIAELLDCAGIGDVMSVAHDL